MSGNVYEWVWDWFEGTYPVGNTTSPVIDPEGPASSAGRVIRGGGWTFYAYTCRSAFRYSEPPGRRGYNLGLRLARSK
jgi:formylglycine-generating enzyme required for sulfatase activity